MTAAMVAWFQSGMECNLLVYGLRPRAQYLVRRLMPGLKAYAMPKGLCKDRAAALTNTPYIAS